MNRDLEIPLSMLIEETILNVIEYIKTKLESGFEFDNKIFPMSISDQVNYTNLLLLPKEVFPQKFPCIDYSTYEITFENKLLLYQASAQHKMSCEGLQSKIISLIKNSNSNAEIIEIYKNYCIDK